MAVADMGTATDRVRPSPLTATARTRSVCDPQVVVNRSTSASSLETWLTTLKCSLA